MPRMTVLVYNCEYWREEVDSASVGQRFCPPFYIYFTPGSLKEAVGHVSNAVVGGLHGAFGVQNKHFSRCR
jgi:hypothetical protein